MMIKKPSNPGPAPPLRSETEGTQTEEAQRGVVREAEKPGWPEPWPGPLYKVDRGANWGVSREQKRRDSQSQDE